MKTFAYISASKSLPRNKICKTNSIVSVFRRVNYHVADQSLTTCKMLGKLENNIYDLEFMI